MNRRLALVASAVLGTTGMAGCAHQHPESTDERYCFTPPNRGGLRPTCVPAVPMARTAEEQSRQLEATRDRLTLIVVHEWAGYLDDPIRLGLDGHALASTVPTSFVRVVVRPGVHRLSFEWATGRQEVEVQGETGAVLFVGLKGRQWLSTVTYGAVTDDQDARRREALKGRLVADISLVGST